MRQALERPPMPAHARRGRPVKVGARTGQELGRALRRDSARHIRVSAARVDQLVQLPALIRQRPRLKCLLDRRTLPGRQVLGGLALPPPIGGLLGSGGGIVGPRRHPVPATPGGFPLDTRGIQAWASHPVSLRLDIDVTIWDVMMSQGFALDRHCSREYVRRVAVIMKLLYLSMMGLQALSPDNGICPIKHMPLTSVGSCEANLQILTSGGFR